MTYLSVQNFTLRTESRLLLNNLDFQLEKASFLAIVGHNGAGKTTFLKALTKQALYEGFVCFKNENSLAYLEQQTQIPFDVPVIELVVMGRYKHTSFFKNYSKADYHSAQEALNTVGLTGFDQRSFSTLSGGEQQLVLIAQLITQEADFILLDEPTQSLDIRNKQRVMNVLQKLNNEGKTIIITTHDIDYLNNVNGFLINFSSPNPQLLPLNDTNIENVKLFLTKE